jgi:NhaA family Na+:H+ antiporter
MTGPRWPPAVWRVSVSAEAFARFFHAEAASSIVLLAATAVALAWANSPWAGSYFGITHLPISVSAGTFSFSLSLQHWINDLLMAVFFFVVGLEIKRELVTGELSTLRKATLPVMAALGGVLVPAAIYWTANAGGPGAGGWGIPMATDIAFAIGILAAFGARVPVGLKVFLTALAIADDLFAVIVIAIFYTETIHLGALALAGALLLLPAAAARANIRRPDVYVLTSLAVWVAVTASKLHPTITGVLVALTIPVLTNREANAAESDEERAMGPALEEYLHPAVAFVILPLFALVNAGVALEADAARNLLQPVGLGVVLGLVLGKQAGIMLFGWLAVKGGRAALPAGVTWTQIYGSACLGGVGFTMSLFVTDLAFGDDRLASAAKVAIIAASVIATGWGALVLRRALPGRRQAE